MPSNHLATRPGPSKWRSSTTPPLRSSPSIFQRAAGAHTCRRPLAQRDHRSRDAAHDHTRSRADPAVHLAWQRALALLPPAVGTLLQPTITLAPTTELFRQLSNSPGYLLAVSRGYQITLQPLPILRRNGAIEPLILHELLHSLIAASPSEHQPPYRRRSSHHCNRHTFCSWLAMAGASIKEIQEAAGHKTITMSARYSHLIDGNDAIEAHSIVEIH